MQQVWRRMTAVKPAYVSLESALKTSLLQSKELSAQDLQIADVVQAAKRCDIQIPPFSQIYNLTSEQAYNIAAELCRQRCRPHTGEELAIFPVGRKIGFTNRNIWAEYNVNSPNWGYMTNGSVYSWSSKPMKSEPFRIIETNQEPKIEPEIIFGIGKPPSASMTDLELLDCIEWVSHGFEIVTSIYPGWKFEGNDTTIVGALHSNLLIDFSSVKEISKFASRSELLTALAEFEVDLYRNGEIQETGRGSNVLGSPVRALRFLVELLHNHKNQPQLQSGEIITTGTLTGAFSISDGDEWHTEIRGIDLPGCRAHFKFTSPAPDLNNSATLRKQENARQKLNRYIDLVNASTQKAAATSSEQTLGGS